MTMPLTSSRRGGDSRRAELLQHSLAIVAECQPCTPGQLRRRLRDEVGASDAEAYRTIKQLIHHQYVRQTVFGELVMPDGGTRSGRGYSLVTKVAIVVGMLAILAFMAWGFAQGLDSDSGSPNAPPAMSAPQDQPDGMSPGGGDTPQGGSLPEDMGSGPGGVPEGGDL